MYKVSIPINVTIIVKLDG